MGESAYKVISIDERSWRIEEGGVRMFLFAGERKALLVDSGFGGGDLFSEVKKLTELPVLLLNTHADRDHTGCNNRFSEAHMHPAEFDRYRQSPGEKSPVCPVWEGDIIELGGRKFEVILIPGHTPGSIALLDAENRVLVGGDSVQSGTIFMFGQGRNMDAYIASMKKLEKLSARFDTVYPSHSEFPVETGIIPALISGAEKVKCGKIERKEIPERAPAKLFDAGAAKFLYEG